MVSIHAKELIFDWQMDVLERQTRVSRRQIISSHGIDYVRQTGTLSSTKHYIDVIMTTMASQITSLKVVYSTVYSDADQRKHQSSASLAFVWGPVNSRHKGPVTRIMFPFDDVIMEWRNSLRSPILLSAKTGWLTNSLFTGDLAATLMWRNLFNCLKCHLGIQTRFSDFARSRWPYWMTVNNPGKRLVRILTL